MLKSGIESVLRNPVTGDAENSKKGSGTQEGNPDGMSVYLVGVHCDVQTIQRTLRKESIIHVYHYSS